MLAELGDRHLRQQRLGGDVALDHMREHRRLCVRKLSITTISPSPSVGARRAGAPTASQERHAEGAAEGRGPACQADRPNVSIVYQDQAIIVAGGYGLQDRGFESKYRNHLT